MIQNNIVKKKKTFFSGSKMWISSSEIAGVYLVMANVNPKDVSLCLGFKKKRETDFIILQFRVTKESRAS